MNKILKVKLFNLIKQDSTVQLELNSKITVLTGHNGVGKSTILASLHSSISSINSGEYIFPRSNWASQITLEKHYELNHFKLSMEIFKSAETKFSEIISQHASHSNIETTFRSITQKSTAAQKEKTVLSTEGEKRDLRAKNIIFFELTDDSEEAVNDIPPNLNSVLYCDELFSFNNPLESTEILEDLDIFSKKNTLDKTLYLLLKDLAVKSPANEQMQEVRVMLSQLTELLADKNISELLSESSVIKFKELQHRSKQGQHPDFIKEANFFFNMTGREVFLNDKNLLSLKIKTRPTETIEWFNLSKGEKTLLCLLLVAYLNGGDETIFLLDEPDLSLHIQWQKQLFKSLITLAPKSQFIVSTHSPALIGHISQETIINIGSLIKR